MAEEAMTGQRPPTAHGAVTVAVGQMSIGGDVAENLAAILNLVRAAAEVPADVLVLPEYALSGSHGVLQYDPRRVDSSVREALKELAEASTEHSLSLVVPSLFRHGGWRSAAHVIEPSRGVTHRHDKTVLTLGERQVLTVGDRVEVVRVGGAPFGILLCAEANGPELLATLAFAGAQIILVAAFPDSRPTAWSEGLSDPWQVDMEALFPLRARMRALSCQTYVVSVVPAGCGSVSRIVDPTGTQVAVARSEASGLVHAELSLSGFPFRHTRSFAQRREAFWRSARALSNESPMSGLSVRHHSQ